MNRTVPHQTSKSLSTGKHKNWLPTLWCEWRNCGDEEYARHLFELLADQPANRRATLIIAVFGAILGAMGGGLITLLLQLTNWNVWPVSLGVVLGYAILTIGIGGGIGRETTWGVWLRSMLPTKPLIRRQGAGFFESLSFQAGLALSSAIGVATTGALFFGQEDRQFFALLIALGVIALLNYYLERYRAALDVAAGIVFGLPVGLLFGLGFAQIAGLTIGPFDVLNSGRVVGLATGAAVGLYLGRGSGLTGLLLFQGIATLLILPLGLNMVLLGWLVGLLVGGVVSSRSQMWGASLNFTEAYRYRVLCLWWFERPFATQVEVALRAYPGQVEWLDSLLRDMDAQQRKPDRLDWLLSRLESFDWRERFLVRHALVLHGGEAVLHLGNLVSTQSHPLQRTATWLLRSIGYETTARLAHQSEQMICPACLTICGPHEVRPAPRPTSPITFFGCRTCRQSRELLHCPDGVAAVLDTNWARKRYHRNGLLRVNWLERRELFDFDRVEITAATDEDVERFTVQVGNDTDPIRDARYPQMPCAINEDCALSENSLRVLRRTFGLVERGIQDDR